MTNGFDSQAEMRDYILKVCWGRFDSHLDSKILNKTQLVTQYVPSGGDLFLVPVYLFVKKCSSEYTCSQVNGLLQ